MRYPAEEAQVREVATVLTEIEAALAELEALHVWVGRTQVTASLADGTTALEMLARQNCLRLKHRILAGAPRSTLPAPAAGALLAGAEQARQECDAMDKRLSALSWETELLDLDAR